MGEIRYIIIANGVRLPENCRNSMGVSKKRFFAHPSLIDDFPCNLTQFCYNSVYIDMSNDMER